VVHGNLLCAIIDLRGKTFFTVTKAQSPYFKTCQNPQKTDGFLKKAGKNRKNVKFLPSKMPKKTTSDLSPVCRFCTAVLPKSKKINFFKIFISFQYHHIQFSNQKKYSKKRIQKRILIQL